MSIKEVCRPPPPRVSFILITCFDLLAAGTDYVAGHEGGLQRRHGGGLPQQHQGQEVRRSLPVSGTQVAVAVVAHCASLQVLLVSVCWRDGRPAQGKFATNERS